MLEVAKVDPKIANLGRVLYSDKSVEKKLIITKADAGPLDLQLQPVKDQAVEAELRTVEAGEKYELLVRAFPKPNDTRIRSRISINTGLKQEPTIHINVFGTVMPRVSARPSSFLVPSTADADWNQTINLVWNSGKPRELTSASVNHPKLEAIVKNEKRKQVVLRLKEALNGDKIPRTVEVKVATADSEAPEISIPVRYRMAQAIRRPGGPGASSAGKAAAAKRSAKASKAHPTAQAAAKTPAKASTERKTAVQQPTDRGKPQAGTGAKATTEKNPS
jgi:hypothetical protein